MNISIYQWDYAIVLIFFQEKMSNLMAGLEFARAYLDDLLVISTEVGFSNHLNKLEQVLNRLSEAGLKINAVKSFFCRTNLEYLGYNISREGIDPTRRKWMLSNRLNLLQHANSCAVS